MVHGIQQGSQRAVAAIERILLHLHDSVAHADAAEQTLQRIVGEAERFPIWPRRLPLRWNSRVQ